MFVDTHVHLNSSRFGDDLEPVLERARQAGVRRFLCPGYDLESSRAALDLAARYPDVQAAVGVHPHDAVTWDAAFAAEVDAALATGRAVAAGEMGLDYYYDHSPRDVQREVLRQQLRLARRHGVPAVIHNRDSDADMAEILTAEAAGMRVVLHAFNGAPQLLVTGVQLGFFFGIGGFLTFKNHALVSCIRDIPRDALLLETDAPYLAPHPMRGQRNEPAFVPHIAARLAAVLDLSVDEVANLTARNYDRFLAAGA